MCRCPKKLTVYVFIKYSEIFIAASFSPLVKYRQYRFFKLFIIVIYHLEERNTDTRQAIANRILELCRERGITPNGLSNLAAVPQSTIKSILNGESKNPGAVSIKKLRDGFEITLGEFFSTPKLDGLEQEIY